MRKMIGVVMILIAVMVANVLWAGDFKPYSGSKVDEKLSQEAMQLFSSSPGGGKYNVVVYTTKDSFEKVCVFYQKIGQEYNMPGSTKSMELPSGKELKTGYFLFGGAKDIPSANSWIKVQNPQVSQNLQVLTPGMKPDSYGEVLGVTTIMHVIKR